MWCQNKLPILNALVMQFMNEVNLNSSAVYLRISAAIHLSNETSQHDLDYVLVSI